MIKILQQLYHSVGIAQVNAICKSATQGVTQKPKMIFPGVRWLRQGWTLSILLLFGISGAIGTGRDRTLAQIAGDTTLGAENSVVTPLGAGGFQIDGGATRGTNLFHSFSQFSVPTGGTAFFNNDLAIENIIGRVIGPASTIDGILQANGTANLFLINPNGISFGSNASLVIGGSFVASTANSITLPDGTIFSATTSQTPPLLTVSVPLGVQFGGSVDLEIGANSGDISVGDAPPNNSPLPELTVLSGNTLALVGGNVTLNGGTLNAPGGQIQLEALANVTLLSSQLITDTTDTTDAGFIQLRANGNVVVESSQLFSSAFGEGSSNSGSILIEAGSISVTDNSFVDTTAYNSGSAGTIVMRSTNQNLTVNTSRITSNGANQSANNDDNTSAGYGLIQLEATAGSVFLNNAILSTTNNSNSGFAGDISISASNQVLVENQTEISSEGDSGLIFIGESESYSTFSPTQVKIDNSTLSTNSQGSGYAGNISISATNQISIANASEIKSESNSSDDNNNSAGKGWIELTTNGSAFINNATLSTNNESGTGEAGYIRILAPDQVVIENNSRISSQGDSGEIEIGVVDGDSFFLPRTATIDNSTLTTSNNAFGIAGDISINAIDQILITNRGNILSDATGEANAGSIFLQTNGSVSMVDSVIGSAVRQEDATGNAGEISIEAGSISLREALVDTDNFGSGVAGNITIRADKQDLIANTSNITSTSNNAIADPENLPFIQLEATQGSVSLNQSTVSTTNFGSNDGFGWAGDVVISARDQVSILNGSNISSNGNFGRILIGQSEPYPDIVTPRVVKIDSSTVQTDDGIPDVFQSGVAGYISIVSSDSIRLSNQARITADTSGEGGNINLESPLILLRGNGKLPQDTLISTNATGLNSPGGNITIETTFLVGVPRENSDITANSRDDRGGNVFVDVSSGGIYGIQFRDQLTPRSEITAKGRDSSLSGNVIIYTSGIDPEKGLAELPVTVTDPSNQIVTGCAAAKGNSFTVTGRGGLPEDPTGTIRGQTVWRDLQDFSQGTEGRQASSPNPQALMASRKPRLVEANSWKYDERGNVVLVAVERNGTPSTYKSNPPQCQDLSSLGVPRN